MSTNKELLEAGLALIPPSLARPVARLNSLYSHLPFDALPLCQRISVWINDWRVDEADVQAAIEQATSPDFMGRVQYNSELHAELAKLVGVARDRRAAAERERAKEAEFQATYVQPTAQAKRFISQVVNGVVVTTAVDAPPPAKDDGKPMPGAEVSRLIARQREKWAKDKR